MICRPEAWSTRRRDMWTFVRATIKRGLHRLALPAITAISLLLPPCGAIAQVTYHRGNTADPETLDPHKTSTVYEANILRDLYEGLVIHDAKGEVVPGVAEKLDVVRRRHGLHLQAARQRQVVERRSGEGLRLRLLLPSHHEPGDGREIRQHPVSRSRTPRRSTRARPSPRSSASRRSTTRRWR